MVDRHRLTYADGEFVTREVSTDQSADLAAPTIPRSARSIYV